jgi:hypothetical protein
MSITPRTGRFLIVALVGLVLLLATETVVLATVATKSGKAVTAVKTVTNDGSDLTASTTYVNLAGMSTTMTVPSTQKALLIITFSAETNCYWEGQMTGFCGLRVLVDGSMPAPGEVFFNSVAVNSGTGAAWQTNSMQWVAGPLNAGGHTIAVQWHVTNENVHFGIDRRTLTVLRSKV